MTSHALEATFWGFVGGAALVMGAAVGDLVAAHPDAYALITNPDNRPHALSGKTGTCVVRGA